MWAMRPRRSITYLLAIAGGSSRIAESNGAEFGVTAHRLVVATLQTPPPFGPTVNVEGPSTVKQSSAGFH